MYSLLILSATAFFLAMWLTVPFSKWLAKRVDAMDRPGEYTIHSTPTPRLGGVGILLAFLICLGLTFVVADIPNSTYRQIFVLLTLLLGMSSVGFVDDMYNVRAWKKFLLQGIIAVLLTLAIVGEANWYVTFIIWFLVVVLINGYNFLDGMDGMAAGIAFVNLLALAAMFLISGNKILMVTAGTMAMATLGFLRHNWTPAKIFMGDVGSLSLGFVISALSLILVVNEDFSINAILAIILTSSFGLGDVFLTTLRRLFNRRPLFIADRGHFYDQMVDRGGLSKLKTLWVSLGLAAIVCGLGIITFILPSRLAIGSFLLGGMILLGAVQYLKISLRLQTVN